MDSYNLVKIPNPDKVENSTDGIKNTKSPKNFRAFCAEGGNRTRTSFAEHRILSPVRLPIPPPRLKIYKLQNANLEILIRRQFFLFNLQSAIWNLQFLECRSKNLKKTIFPFQSAICNLESAIFRMQI